MNELLQGLFMYGLLVVGGQQTQGQGGAPATAESPVAEAARAARERQKNALPKHVLTDDDVTSSRGTAESTAGLLSEEQVRAQMEKTYPKLPTAGDIQEMMARLRNYSAEGPDELLKKFRDSALHNQETVEFPGKKDWGEQLDISVHHWVEESGRAAQNLQDILDANQSILASRDPAGLGAVRARWINVMIPCGRWQSRVSQLVDEGASRANAFRTNNTEALAAYRRSRVSAAESGAGVTAIRFNEEEAKYQKQHGRYVCDLGVLGIDLTNPDGRLSRSHEWMLILDSLHYNGYRLSLESCTAEQYVVLLVPPVSDGSQGRVFCATQKGQVLVGEDGQTAGCVSSGKEWHAQ